jgi:hypothetical protein
MKQNPQNDLSPARPKTGFKKIGERFSQFLHFVK